MGEYNYNPFGEEDSYDFKYKWWEFKPNMVIRPEEIAAPVKEVYSSSWNISAIRVNDSSRTFTLKSYEPSESVKRFREYKENLERLKNSKSVKNKLNKKTKKTKKTKKATTLPAIVKPGFLTKLNNKVKEIIYDLKYVGDVNFDEK